jgi:hypothetical protein
MPCDASIQMRLQASRQLCLNRVDGALDCLLDW